VWDSQGKYAPLVLSAVGAFIGLLALAALVNIDFPLSLIVAVPCGALAAFMLIAASKSSKATIIGPQPFKRKTEDFGPSTALASVNHPSNDDLAYKPTV
jgi:hypothetical protein